MNNRKKHSLEFKAKVALEAIKGQKTIAELCKDYSIHASILNKWKKQLLENAVLAFGSKKQASQEQDISQLHAKIGELLVERDFLKKALKL